MTTNPADIVGEELRKELKKILARTIALRAVVGFLSFVAVAGWVFLAAVLWVALARSLSLPHALALSGVVAGVLILAFIAVVVLPLVRVPSLKKLAFELERRREFHDLVTAGYELSESEDAQNRYSPELIREVVRQAVRSISGLQVRFLFIDRRQLALVPVAYAALAALIVIGTMSPGVLLDTARTIVTPRSVGIAARRANLFCSPGSATVLAGTDVEVIARDYGGSKEPVTLSYTLSNDFWKTEPVAAREASGREAAAGEHAYTFKDVRGNISYYFERGGKRTPSYTITVVHKPVVTDLSLVLTPPSYTGEAPDTLIDSGGNVSALEGTRVAISGKANNVLFEAWIEFDGGEKQPARTDGRKFGIGFTAVRDGSYSIALKDTLGHETEDPVVYTVDAFEDRPPVLDVLEPGGDSLLPRNLLVALGFTAADDYGIQKAAVFHRKGSDEEYEKTDIPLGSFAGNREILVTYEWSLEGTTLFPGESVEYYLEVADNNVVTGPGVVRSRVFRISVPTMAELYEQVEDESAKRTDMAEEALKEGTDLKERLEKLSREMKKTDGMDWSQKKEVDDAIASQEKIQDMLGEIQKSLDETLQSLSENRMTSQDIGEKIENIQRLIEEIDSDALKKYIEEMRAAMEKLDPKQIQQALENMNTSTADLLKNLERTEALLKEIQREQQMEELVRKTKDLMEAQEAVSDSTARADDKETMDKLSREQEELAEQAADLENNLDETSKDLDDKDIADQLQKASEKNSMSRTSKEMKEASSQLQEGQKNQAMSHQEQAMQNLIGLFGSLANLQMQMQMNSNNQLSANLQRLANNTLDISFKEESLTARMREQISAGEDPDRVAIRELAEEQQKYARAVGQIADELFEMSKETFMVPRALIQALGTCKKSMENSLLFLEQNKAFMSAASATEATTTLNAITIDLLRTCKNCSSGGSGKPQGSPMLQKLLAGQQQVLKETEQLLALRAAQERLVQEMQADVKRLAGEQRSLREIAEDMKNDLKQNERVLGRMDKIAEEMDEVIKDLESGDVNEGTLQKEERILSRLLDAQRSVHTRDYEKDRVSRTAGDVYSKPSAASSVQPASQLLREEIRRAMALKAPGEFEDLIRLYFRALAEETSPAPGTE